MPATIPVFGVQIDINLFIASLPSDNIVKAIAATGAALLQKSLSLRKAQPAPKLCDWGGFSCGLFGLLLLATLTTALLQAVAAFLLKFETT